MLKCPYFIGAKWDGSRCGKSLFYGVIWFATLCHPCIFAHSRVRQCAKPRQSRDVQSGEAGEAVPHLATRGGERHKTQCLSSVTYRIKKSYSRKKWYQVGTSCELQHKACHNDTPVENVDEESFGHGWARLDKCVSQKHRTQFTFSI